MTADPHRIAWITGAGKGIGRALSMELARNGWIVAASARTEADLKSLENEADGVGWQIVPFPLDVTDHNATLATVRRIERAIGAVDLAVLNAGTHLPMRAGDFSVDPFRKLLEVNMLGAAHCLDAVLPGMRRRGSGQIAVVASLAGYRGLPTASAYGASKAALINMCEALKPELERDGIDLRLINPGFVRTPLTDRNDFPMPFLISAADAATCIRHGLEGRKFEIAFPGRFAFLMWLLRLLPDRLFFALSRRMIADA